jgi:hypothetical protein
VPDTTRSLLGADENPEDDLDAEAPRAIATPAVAEDNGGLAHAIDGDGRLAARVLQRWMAERYHRNLTPTHVWGAIRRTPGALEIARRQGYGQFVCRTHGQIHCRECACPTCGAPGGCNCGARQIKEYNETPQIPPRIAGVRRVSIEAEMMFVDSSAIQRALGEYPWGHRDASLNESGWYRGAEFKINGYGNESSRKVLADIIHRIGRVGGVGAPRCCGLHVHVDSNASTDTMSDIRTRWLAIEEDMYSLFPTRRNNGHCMSLLRSTMRDHHAVVSGLTRHNTWEVRIHPGTTSWVAIACWSDWCRAFVSNGVSAIGNSYLAARRAQLVLTPGKGFPWAWRRSIERWFQRNGQSYHRTLQAIARGTFARWQTADGLRTALAGRTVAA